MQWKCLTVCFWMLQLSSLLMAGEGPHRHRILVAQYQGPGGNRLIEVSPEGKLTWEHTPPSICVMFQILPKQHLLYAYGGKPTGVREIDRKKNVVWDYVSQSPQVLAGERLANGNTLLAEQGPSRVVEVNSKGDVVSSVNVPNREEAFHRQLRVIHRLRNGNVLAAIEAEGSAREVDPNGKVVWEITGLADVYEALRLPNGNTLVACGTQKRVIEVTPAGKIVWELTAQDVPELNLTWVTSLQVLHNGNFVIGNFLRGQEGKGAHAFEINRAKKVLWKFADHTLVKTATMVRVLDK
jgi:Mal s 1 allergenic protein-like